MKRKKLRATLGLIMAMSMVPTTIVSTAMPAFAEEVDEDDNWDDVFDDEDEDYGETTNETGVVSVDGAETMYGTFQEALSAAQEIGGTVKLYGDVDLYQTQTISKNVTIDLNGWNIHADGVRAFHITGGDVMITGEGEIASYEYSMIDMDPDSSVIRVGDNSGEARNVSLTIDEDVHVRTDCAYGISVFGSATTETLDIEGSVGQLADEDTGDIRPAISGNGSAGYGGTTIKIGENATVTTRGGLAIYHPQSGDLTVDGLVKGGIEMKGGNLTVTSEGVVKSNSDLEETHVPNNDGPSTTGYAIALVRNTNYAGVGEVSIDDDAWISGDTVKLCDGEHDIVVLAQGEPAYCDMSGMTDELGCSFCGEITQAAEEIPELGHDYQEVEGTPATCTTDGVTGHMECTRCGDIDYSTGGKTIYALGHDISEYVYNDDAYCDHDATRTGTCARCGETVTEPIPDTAPGTHTLETIPAKEATCTEMGHTEGKKCSVCGEIIVEPEDIPATGHTEEVMEAKDATCTEDGLTEGVKCSVCGTILQAQQGIPATGHTEEIIESKEATCTEDGMTEGKKCSVCGEILTAQEVIPALGHDYGEDGICTRCGEADPDADECSVKGHTEVVIEGKEATCTEDGLTEGKKCSVCGEILEAQEVIPAKGHTEEVIEGKEATCTEDGLTEGKKCSVCGTILQAQQGIPATGHTEEVIEGKEATCTEDGLTEGKKCSVCGDILQAQQGIPATGHTYATTTTKATTSKDGSIVKKCTVCEKTKTSVISAIKSVTLSGTSFTYTGKAITPTVTVLDSNDNEISDIYYTVTYSNNKAVGTATAKVTFKTRYSGTISQTFTIKPQASTISSVTNVAKGVKITWSQVTGATGYKIYRGSTLIATIKKNATVTYTDTAATKNGTKYTYKVKAYTTGVGNAAASAAKTIYRLTAPTIKSLTNSASKTMTVKWSKNSKATGYQVKYVVGSTTKTVTIKSATTVSKVIKSLTKGKTYKVYVRSYLKNSSGTYYSAWTGKSLKISQ